MSKTLTHLINANKKARHNQRTWHKRSMIYSHFPTFFITKFKNTFLTQYKFINAPWPDFIQLWLFRSRRSIRENCIPISLFQPRLERDSAIWARDQLLDVHSNKVPPLYRSRSDRIGENETGYRQRVPGLVCLLAEVVDPSFVTSRLQCQRSYTASEGLGLLNDLFLGYVCVCVCAIRVQIYF